MTAYVAQRPYRRFYADKRKFTVFFRRSFVQGTFMSFLNLGSIRKNLALLVILTVLPAMAILLSSGLERRKDTIDKTRHDVLLLTHTMAHTQEDIAHSARDILSTLALTTEVQALDVQNLHNIFRNLLKGNPIYRNFTLVDLDGNVLASGLPTKKANLADRKHFRDALRTKGFATGEYIVARVGNPKPSFPFAYPVLDATGTPKAVLTAAINLSYFSELYDHAFLPQDSYVAVTDHQGIRLFYYPPKVTTNPIGKPIKAGNWQVASQAQEQGIMTATGSDGTNRILAFEQVRLNIDAEPYLYVWTGVPEAFVLAPANTNLQRNLLLMLLAATGTLVISWFIGRKTLIAPINKLTEMTNEVAKGNLKSRIEQTDKIDEFVKLTDSFHGMAESLSISHEELRDSENKFRIFADYTHDWEYWSDSDGAYIYISPSCERITGYKPEEFMSHPDLLIEITTPEFKDDLRCHLAESKAQGFPACQKMFSITTKGGELRWLEHLCLPIYDGQDKYIGRRGCNRDITSRIQAENERQELEAQLRQKYKMDSVGVMAGGMAHNFNNNLSIILGNIQLLQMKLPPDSELGGYLENAQIAVLRSRDLIQQILTYSRQEHKDKTLIELPLVIDETLQLLNSTLPSTINLQKKISSDSHSLSISADPSQIQECLINLCNNAMHAMDEKGDLLISLEIVEMKQHDIPAQYDSKPGLYAKLSVQDNGSGMSPETMDKIFDLFFTTKQVDEGTGVGLSTVQGIVTQHAGLIKVESALGEGSTFELYFPIIAQPETTEPSPHSSAFPGGKEKILYIDDDEDLANLGEMMLSEMGYQVTTMTESQKALQHFASNPDHFDLVITDQTMPQLTGKELIQKLKQLRPDIQTIICTGHSSKIDEEKAQKLGADAFLMKPLDMSVLLQTIRLVLDKNEG
jgi:PAS domain S-box-containing protein